MYDRRHIQTIVYNEIIMRLDIHEAEIAVTEDMWLAQDLQADPMAIMDILSAVFSSFNIFLLQDSGPPKDLQIRVIIEFLHQRLNHLQPEVKKKRILH